MQGYGEFIKKHRIASGYKSQRKLAAVTNISNATIARIERELQLPERRTLQTLAKYLHTTTFNELMSVCDHEKNIKKVQINVDSLNSKLKLSVDGEVLSDDELKCAIDYVRSLRTLQ